MIPDKPISFYHAGFVKFFNQGLKSSFPDSPPSLDIVTGTDIEVIADRLGLIIDPHFKMNMISRGRPGRAHPANLLTLGNGLTFRYLH